MCKAMVGVFEKEERQKCGLDNCSISQGRMPAKRELYAIIGTTPRYVYLTFT